MCYILSKNIYGISRYTIKILIINCSDLFSLNTMYCTEVINLMLRHMYRNVELMYLL